MPTTSINHNPSAYSDKELVRLIQSGNQKAVSDLILRYVPIVQRFASAYFGVSPDSDDLVQEGILALLSAAYTYSPDKSAAFSTYSAVCINNRMRSYLRELSAKGNLPLRDYIPLQDIEIASDSDPYRQFAAEEAVNSILQFIHTELSPLEKRVLHYYLQGYSYGQIAKKLNGTPKSVNNALQRLRSKLKTAIGNQ